MSGLRERNKAKRRDAILDAAADLLRSGDLAGVTTEQVANAAELSLATVYNLVGTRDQLFIALIERVINAVVTALAELDAGPPMDPIERVRHINDLTVEAFVADSVVYRQVVRVVGAVDTTRLPLRTDPAQLQIANFRAAQAAGIIRPEIDPGGLGRQIYLCFVGAMLAWSRGTLDDEGFRVAARHGLLTVVAGAATDAHRDRFLGALAECGRDLAAAQWTLS